ncbi:WxcM-like domain-containing protein [Henriciella marina]|uniref:WxcM-like domain-containing protein n=1 Tax=Henriciella marina TaxID=453851 RepID=UPI0012EA65F3|nr:WxcM-like domain-containing protein [Henriciella marina]
MLTKQITSRFSRWGNQVVNSWQNSILPESAQISESATIGPRVILAGDGIVLRDHVRLDAACVIGEGVTVGQGAWVRAGAVVLRSVPPNAIVEGNPAQVVGYLNGTNPSTRPDPRLIDIHGFEHMDRPARVPLKVGGSALYLMRRVADARGALTVGEVPTEVPFTPARYFAVFDVPTVELRGEHAHKQCQQFLICLHGSCRILLDDGYQRCEVVLDRPDMGVFMPEMIWGTQYRYSGDAVLLVFASHSYEAEDYLRTYDDFLSERERRMT